MEKQSPSIGTVTTNPDPTYNVMQLVEAAVARLDDIALLRAESTEKMLQMEVRRINEQMILRASFTEQLYAAEKSRIDAIRAVDVGAVAIASERAAQQATVLANQVAASAETLRALVASTAATVASQLASVSGALNERLSTLEKSSYVGSGRSAVSDPMLTALVEEMRSLRESRDKSTGKSVGSQAMWGYVSAGIGLIMAMVGVGLTIFHAVK